MDIDSAISKLEDLFEELLGSLAALKIRIIEDREDLERENQELREALGDVEVEINDDYSARDEAEEPNR